MGNYIKSVELNILDGLLVGRMSFQPGLNILSGENGTFKTKTLQAIKTNAPKILFDQQTSCRMQAISPKRNAQRRAFKQIYEQFRRENKKLEAVINERNISDHSFEEYPSLGDLYYVVFEDLCKDGGNQKEKMQEATDDFNTVISKVFSNYKLMAEWDDTTGTPTIELLKHGVTHVPLEGLSLGEQEILSLATNIYSSRNRYDVFLIDEPEVHLNWDLEEKLFKFFDDYCLEFNKQMIIVTHSRVVFKGRYHPKTQFLYWTENGKVSWGKNVTDKQRRRIAGDAIEIIKLGDFSKPTFFVEDTVHIEIIQAIANQLGVEVIISECGNSPNVRSLFRFSKLEAGWENSYFIEDGDNQGSPFPDDPNFIHLDKYCMENYLLNSQVAGNVCSLPEDQIKQFIVQSVLDNKQHIFKKNKFFEFLVDHLQPQHLTDENLAKLDASQIMEAFLGKIGKSLQDYVQQYIQNCTENDSLKTLLPRRIVEIIEQNQIPNPIEQEGN
ncbi:AAA family ATPase [Caldithrix abyssi]|nr:AAA family ATPase [Caldithrix abyssi]